MVDVRVDAVRFVLDASFDLFGTAQRRCVRIRLLLQLLWWRWRRGYDAARENKGGRGRESALKSFVHRMIQGGAINRINTARVNTADSDTAGLDTGV